MEHEMNIFNYSRQYNYLSSIFFSRPFRCTAVEVDFPLFYTKVFLTKSMNFSWFFSSFFFQNFRTFLMKFSKSHLQFCENVFFLKAFLQNVCQNPKFLDKIRNICQNPKFLVKLRNLPQNPIFLTKIRNVCQNPKFLDKIKNVRQNQKFLDKIRNF